MATGEFAEPIYDLLDQLGGPENSSNLVLQNLIKWLPGETIRSFVDDFRRNYDMNDSIVQAHFDPEVDAITEDMEIDTSSLQIEETQPPTGESRFFSSRIPEC